MWKGIDSITMSRYNLNISINSIMLLSTYEPAKLSQKSNWSDSIKSIKSIYLWPFLGKYSISLTFLQNLRYRLLFLVFFLINWIDSTIPVAQSQSTQSPTPLLWNLWFMIIYSWPFGCFFWWFAHVWFGLGRGPTTPPRPAMVFMDRKDLN